MDNPERQNTCMENVDLDAEIGAIRDPRETDGEHEQRVQSLFEDVIPAEEEILLDQLWNNRVREVAVGKCWIDAALKRANKKTFVPAMRGVVWWEALDATRRDAINRRVKYVQTVYKHWHSIVMYCTLPHMKYVDVRRLSLYELSRCIDLWWVEDYNNRHNPNRKRNRVEKLFAGAQIEALLKDPTTNTANNATKALLRTVRDDRQQYRLLANDIADAMANIFIDIRETLH